MEPIKKILRTPSAFVLLIIAVISLIGVIIQAINAQELARIPIDATLTAETKMTASALSISFSPNNTPTSMITFPTVAGESVIQSSPIVIKTYHGKYVTAMNNEANRNWVLRGSAQTISNWEKFTLLCLTDDKAALKTYHDKYVTALEDEDTGDWIVKANAQTISPCEKFTLHEVYTEKQLSCRDVIKSLGQNPINIAFKTYYGKYISAMNDEGNRNWILGADAQIIQAWEIFSVTLP